MIIEPEKYFQYTIPKMHTIQNGRDRDFSDKAVVGYDYFISAYKDKKLVVLISKETQAKLQSYYNTYIKGNMPLLPLSQTSRWYANGFISAYNYCEQYEQEHLSAKVDFSEYADSLEQRNVSQSSKANNLNRDYIINVGRIEGVRFYLVERERTPVGDDAFGETHASKSKEDIAPMVNSTGLTLVQNLKPASYNQRLIAAIGVMLEQHKGKKSRRTIVGIWIIGIRDYVTPNTTDDILIKAFRNDYFPEDKIDDFAASVRRVLRSYSKKEDANVSNPDERWGEQKESTLQEVKTLIKKAISGLPL